MPSTEAQKRAQRNYYIKLKEDQEKYKLYVEKKKIYFEKFKETEAYQRNKEEILQRYYKNKSC